MSGRGVSGDDHRGSDLPTESNRTVNPYVAADPSLAAFPPCRPRSTAAPSQSRKTGPDFFNRISMFMRVREGSFLSLRGMSHPPSFADGNGAGMLTLEQL